MRKFNQMRLPELPLRIRLTLWYSAALALILFLFAGFLYIQLQRSLFIQVDATLQVAAAQAHITLGEDGGQLAFQGVENRLVAARTLNDLVVIYLVAQDGAIWDQLGSETDAPIVTPPKAGYTTLVANGEPWRVYVQPVSMGQKVGWLQTVQTLEPVEQTLQSLLTQMLIGVPIAILLASAGGFFLASRALQPIDRITRTAQSINASELHQRIGYTGPADEVGRLAATFDTMIVRLQTAFERQRRFTGDAAHELRTPLTALKGRIGVTISQPRQQTEYRETLLDMEQQVDRLIRLSNDLLFMARLDQGRRDALTERINLGDLLRVIIEQVRPLAEAKSISLTETIPTDVIIPGRMDLLIRLFLNLLDNAIKYTPANGWVAINVQQQMQHVEVAIRDSGPGIAAEHMPHLFERFYRVEDDRARSWNNSDQGGAGLGLAIAYEIVRNHAGQLVVESEEGQGAMFVVHLPASVGAVL